MKKEQSEIAKCNQKLKYLAYLKRKDQRKEEKKRKAVFSFLQNGVSSDLQKLKAGIWLIEDASILTELFTKCVLVLLKTYHETDAIAEELLPILEATITNDAFHFFDFDENIEAFISFYELKESHHLEIEAMISYLISRDFVTSQVKKSFPNTKESIILERLNRYCGEILSYGDAVCEYVKTS